MIPRLLGADHRAAANQVRSHRAQRPDARRLGAIMRVDDKADSRLTGFASAAREARLPQRGVRRPGRNGWVTLWFMSPGLSRR